MASTKTTAAPALDFKQAFLTRTSYDITVPEDAGKQTRESDMPFLDWFTSVEADAKAGKQPHNFVPLSYFKGRADKPDNVDASYAKDKLRGQAKLWKKKAEKEGARDGFVLILVTRSGVEKIKGIGEPGVSVWLTHPAAATPAKKK